VGKKVIRHRPYFFLQENGVTEYAQLEKKAEEATTVFNDISVKIKQAVWRGLGQIPVSNELCCYV
jgi:hypothetical protein